MQLSKRRSLIDSSGIRKVFDLASKMKDPINLSIGLPDYDVPDNIKEVAIDAIRNGKNRYTLTAGVLPLKNAIHEYYEKKQLPHEDVIVTSGTSGALFLAMLAILDPGDELLIPDPYFVMYKQLSRFIGAVPVYVDCYPEFRMTRAALEKVWTPKAKMLILNSPGNPTGVVMSEKDCREVAEFAEEKNLIVISDEIYEAFSYDSEFLSPAKFLKEPLIISGLSKSTAMTGWRVGWVAGPNDVIKAMTEIQQYTYVCAPSPAQEAAVEALKYPMEAICDDYRERRDMIFQGLVSAGYQVTKPGGAFYIFPEAPNGNGDEFVKEAIEHNLLMVPGSVFSERNTHFRISFAASKTKLNAGIDALKVLADKHLNSLKA